MTDFPFELMLVKQSIGSTRKVGLVILIITSYHLDVILLLMPVAMVTEGDGE